MKDEEYIHFFICNNQKKASETLSNRKICDVCSSGCFITALFMYCRKDRKSSG